MKQHKTPPSALPPLIRLAGASVTRGGALLLDSIDFRLEVGGRIAVLGQNGAGKTTLLRLLRGDISPDATTNCEDARFYAFPGQDGPQATALGLRQRLALVSGDMQDLYARHEWAITGLEAVLTGFYDTPLLYAEPTAAERAKAQDSMKALGLEHLADRRMASLSSGQARAVLLARALCCTPDALFLDECLEGLDAPARHEFLAALDHIATANPQLALLFCSHRTEELPACLTQALVLEAGRICAFGPLALVLAQSATEQAPFRQFTPSQAPTGQTSAEQPASAPTANIARDTRTVGLADAKQKAGLFTTRPTGNSREFLVRITNADVVLDGVNILHQISWTILPGEHWAVLGKNGAGKSTLLGLLAGDHWPSALRGAPGLVEYGFAEPEETLDQTHRHLGRVSAGLDRDYSVNLRVDETVWSGALGSIGLYAEVDTAMKVRAQELLEFFGIAKLHARPIRSLSRGQLRRVMLARAMLGPGVQAPALLLLDEPMAGLDARARKNARELLSRLAVAGVPLVLVTHHGRDLPEQVNRVLVLAAGRIVFCGDRAEY